MQKKGRYWRWVVGISVLIYLLSFAVLRYRVIPDYEVNTFPERHPLRPIYATIYYPLRLLSANGWSLIPQQPKGFVGKLDEVKEDRIAFDYGDRTLSIGFVCTPDTCANLKQVKRGDEVEATFGSALIADRDGFINKLLSIRPCGPNDDRCAVTRERQRLENQESERTMEASRKAHSLCFEAMALTLQSDPRYISPPASNEDFNQAAADKFNALVGQQRTCRDSVIEGYQRAVIESCKRHKCGENIGGGCLHNADLIHSGVIARAVEKCVP
jgi:hypothetical protein